MTRLKQSRKIERSHSIFLDRIHTIKFVSNQRSKRHYFYGFSLQYVVFETHAESTSKPYQCRMICYESISQRYTVTTQFTNGNLSAVCTDTALTKRIRCEPLDKHLIPRSSVVSSVPYTN